MMDRTKFIGASDVPVILGLVSWKSPEQLWLEKTGHCPESEPTDAMVLGKYLERALEAYVAERYEIQATQVGYDTVISDVPLHATLDVVTKNPSMLIELKTTGIVGPRPNYRQWGEPESDKVPLHVWTQVQAQMLVSGIEHARVVALLGGIGLIEYIVPREPSFQELVIEPLATFWRHVQTKTPLDSSRPEYAEKLRGLRPENPDHCEITPESSLWNDLVNIAIARNLEKKLAAYVDQAVARVFAALPEYKKIASPIVTISRYTMHSTRIDIDKLKREYPEVYQECLLEKIVESKRITVKQTPSFDQQKWIALLTAGDDRHE